MKKFLSIGLLVALSVTIIFSFAMAKSSGRAWIGIATQTVNEELADAFDLKITYGAIVNEIMEDSPAKKAGLLESDVIIAYNSEKIYDYDDLIDHLEDSSPEEIITLTVMRENDKKTFEITLGKTTKRNRRHYGNYGNVWLMPNIPNIPDMPDMSHLSDLQDNFSFESSSYIGVHLTELSDQLREHFGVKEDVGVLVSTVEEDSPAEKAGIKAGDIIIEADNNDISDYGDLKKSIKDKEEGETISVILVRDKSQKQFDVAIAEHENENRMFFNAPDISLNVPNGNRHMTFFSDDFDNLNEFFNSDEFNEEMKDLKKELENLKLEIKNELFEQFNSDEFKQEMKKFRKELKLNEVEINQELKVEFQKLRNEFRELEKKLDD